MMNVNPLVYYWLKQKMDHNYGSIWKSFVGEELAFQTVYMCFTRIALREKKLPNKLTVKL